MTGLISWPSPGFVLLALVSLGAFSFFAFGLSTPRLDHVWKLEKELLVGERPALDDRERRILDDALTDYPALAEAMTNGDLGLVSRNDAGAVEIGYAYLVRRNAGSRMLVLSLFETSRRGAVAVQIRIREETWILVLEEDTPTTWRLPDEGPFPHLVEIKVLPSKDSRPPAFSVRVEGKS